jgi:hypothetical protein
MVTEWKSVVELTQDNIGLLPKEVGSMVNNVKDIAIAALSEDLPLWKVGVLHPGVFGGNIAGNHHDPWRISRRVRGGEDLNYAYCLHIPFRELKRKASSTGLAEKESLSVRHFNCNAVE